MDSKESQKTLVERAFWSSSAVETVVAIVFYTVTF